MFDLFNKLIARLELLGIPYMLSGSVVLNVYAMPRMTRDIDVVIHLQDADIDAFVRAFSEDFYYHLPTIQEEVRRRGMFNLIDNHSGYKVDFMIRKDTDYRKTEFERRKKSAVLGIDTWIVSLEDLIISKLIWTQELQSDKQLADIESLLENPTLDTQYLNYWIKKLQLNTFNLL